MDCSNLRKVLVEARLVLNDVRTAIAEKPRTLSLAPDAWCWNDPTSEAVMRVAAAVHTRFVECGLFPDRPAHGGFEVFRDVLVECPCMNAVALWDIAKELIATQEGASFVVAQWSQCLHTLVSAEMRSAKGGVAPLFFSDELVKTLLPKWMKRAHQSNVVTACAANASAELRMLHFAARFGEMITTPLVEPTSKRAMSLQAAALIVNLNPLVAELPFVGFITRSDWTPFTLMRPLCKISTLAVTELDTETAKKISSAPGVLAHVGMESFCTQVRALVTNVATTNESMFGLPSASRPNSGAH